MRRSVAIVVPALALAAVVCIAVPAADEAGVPYPEGYREWAHAKSMVIQEGHPLFAAFGGIHHVYVNDKAEQAVRKGAKSFPDGSVFVFDLLETHGEGNAITEGERKVVGVMHKDSKRYAATGGWGFEGFKGDSRDRAVTDANGQCFSCHAAQKTSDYVFTNWRP
jgi:hypothetical protein